MRLNPPPWEILILAFPWILLILRFVVILRSTMLTNMCKFARTTGGGCYSQECGKWPWVRLVQDRPANQVSTHAWSFLAKRFFNTSSILSLWTTRYDHTQDISPLLTVHSVHKHHWGSWIPKPSPFTASRLTWQGYSTMHKASWICCSCVGTVVQDPKARTICMLCHLRTICNLEPLIK